MRRITHSMLLLATVLVLSACIPASPTSSPAAVKLTVQTQNGATTFSQAGEVITYQYVVTNTGTKILAGPVTVLDGAKQVNCPAVNTVGNLDNNLDQNETILCGASYVVTQADVTTASITNTATASIGGVRSNQSGITLTLSIPTSSHLQVAKTANPQAYSQVGQIITYTYVITNSGSTPLGPTQFTISDNRLGAPFPCGPGDTTLAPSQSLSCSASYSVTQADIILPELTNSATASGAGQTSAPVSVSILNLALSGTEASTPFPSVTLVPGMTVQHEVMEGEWLSQIVRCYGANLSAVQNANPEITDPEATLSPPMTLTIPSIGSDDMVHGLPCLVNYTVEAGDTWESIASRYRVDVLILKDANRDVTLTSGARLRIPLYSPGHNPYPPGYDSASAQRIEVAAGGSPLVLAGLVPPLSRVWYVVTLPQTHILSLKLTGAPDALTLAVYDTYGEPHNPFGGPQTWTGFIPLTGDYYIKVTEVRGAATEPYTLEASLVLFISSPTPPPSGTSQP